MENCETCENEVKQPGVGLKFDLEANLIYVGVFMLEGSASLGMTLDEAIRLKDNLDKVILEAQASHTRLDNGE